MHLGDLRTFRILLSGRLGRGPRKIVDMDVDPIPMLGGAVRFRRSRRLLTPFFEHHCRFDVAFIEILGDGDLRSAK